jgi:hypothetical protein
MCSTHGRFQQNYKRLTNGIGCAKCGGVAKKDPISYVEEITRKFGTFCDYSRVVYLGARSTVEVVCPIHGVFSVIACNYLNLYKHPCPKCGIDNRVKNQFDSAEDFIRKAVSVHGSLYDYSKVVYVGSKMPVEIVCKTHGSFLKSPNKHISYKGGCQRCSEGNRISKGESSLLNKVSELGLAILKNNRGILPGRKELDMYFPELKTGIEYNGILWHSEYKGSKFNLLDKTKLGEAVGVKVLHIFEDEWENDPDRVINITKAVLGTEINDKQLVKECSTLFGELTYLDRRYPLLDKFLRLGYEVIEVVDPKPWFSNGYKNRVPYTEDIKSSNPRGVVVWDCGGYLLKPPAKIMGVT